MENVYSVQQRYVAATLTFLRFATRFLEQVVFTRSRVTAASSLATLLHVSQSMIYGAASENCANRYGQ
jgi:hypothetical protein